MSAATMVLGADSSGPRRTLAFSLSLALHLTFALLIFVIAYYASDGFGLQP